jgi:hypothetical protein
MSRVARVAVFGLSLAVLAALAMALAPLGYRAGAWGLRVALYYLVGGGLLLAVLSAVVSLVAAILAQRSESRAGLRPALAGLAIAVAAAALPVAQIVRARSLPAIHDITTDTGNPPPFVALAPVRRAAPNGIEYAGERIAQLQRAAYPDITTFRSTLPPAELFARAARLATESGWHITQAAPNEGRIEATDTTKLFGFRDDVVVRIRPDGAGCVLDMRSMSRVGVGDIGANAARIRAFLARLRTREP